MHQELSTILLIPGGKMAFVFKALMFLAEDFQLFQWGSGRSKIEDVNEHGNRQRLGSLSFEEERNFCCLYGIPQLCFLLMTIARADCQTEWFLILPNVHSNTKLWFWNTSYFINPLHIQLFFNLTRLAVELMFKPVFYVYLMNLSEDITDEFRHLWIHVIVYEIKL